jgi:hypothetical protein
MTDIRGRTEKILCCLLSISRGRISYHPLFHQMHNHTSMSRFACVLHFQCFIPLLERNVRATHRLPVSRVRHCGPVRREPFDSL